MSGAIRYVTSISLYGELDWLWYCLISLYTFRKYHPNITPIVMCVPSDDVSKNESFYSALKMLGCDYLVTRFSLKEKGFFNNVPESSVWKAHMIEATWLRLDLPLHFKDIDYVFFFDVDTIFRTNITPMVYQICKNTPPKHIMLTNEGDYNMGMFIINIKNMTLNMKTIYDKLMSLGMVFSMAQENEFMLMHFRHLLESTLDKKFNARAYAYLTYDNPYIIHFHGAKPRDYLSYHHHLGYKIPQFFLNAANKFLNKTQSEQPLSFFFADEKNFVALMQQQNFDITKLFSEQHFPIYSIVNKQQIQEPAKISYVTSISLYGESDWLWYCLISLYTFKQRHPDITPVVMCVPSADETKNAHFYHALETLHCDYIVTNFSLKAKGFFDNVPQTGSSGVWKAHMIEATWLRLDLPMHFKEADYIFFFDVDTVFQINVDPLVREICRKNPPNHMIVINHNDYNMGVFIMNVKNMAAKLDEIYAKLLSVNIADFSEGQDNDFMTRYYKNLLERRLDNNFNTKAYWYGNYTNPYIIHFHGPKPRDYLSYYHKLDYRIPRIFLDLAHYFLNRQHSEKPLQIFFEYEKKFVIFMQENNYDLDVLFEKKHFPIYSIIPKQNTITASVTS